MFVFNGRIACVLGLQRNSFYTTRQKSNLQLIQQETCRHPQGFVLLLPRAEKEPVPRTGTARGSRATSGWAGGYPRALPELPADTPRCAAGGGKAPPRLSSPALAARSRHGPGADQRLAAGAVLFPPQAFFSVSSTPSRSPAVLAFIYPLTPVEWLPCAAGSRSFWGLCQLPPDWLAGDC